MTLTIKDALDRSYDAYCAARPGMPTKLTGSLRDKWLRATNAERSKLPV